MEQRRLGKTEHMSSIITFGGAALWDVSQSEANNAAEMAVEHGINHFDVAPSYGKAELLLGPWIQKNRNKIFLACKTTERGKNETCESIKRSLDLLKTDFFDLFQFHGVQDIETLNVVLGPMGALEAVLEAKGQGLIRHIGITGHRPFVLIEALNRFDFATLLFPINRVLAAHRNDFNDFLLLLEIARQKDVGTIAIKAITKQPWEAPMRMYRTWYEPFDEPDEVEKSIWFTLSQDVTTAALPADLRLWPLIIDAAERFRTLDKDQQKKVIAAVKQYKPLFPNDAL